MVGQSTTVHLDVTAVDGRGTGSTEIVLRVPSYFTVTGGTPAGYIVDPGSPPGALGVTEVLWQTSLITGTTQTFTLNVTPLAATAGTFHDEVQAHVHLAGSGRLDGEAEVVYVRAGDASHVASVQEEWPDALAVLSRGIPFIPTNGITLTDIPEMQPLSADLQWGTFVDASTPVSLQIPIRNTNSSMVSFTGTLTLPPGWIVLSGPAAIAGALAPGQSMMLSYQVLPAQISCGWTAKLYLRVDAGTIAQCKDDVQLVQQGGLYPCEGPADWLDPGEPAAGRTPYDGAIERVPVRPCQPSPPPCAQCARNVYCLVLPPTGGPVPPYNAETMKVTGRIFALVEYPKDSYLGNLRLRILEPYTKGAIPTGSGPPGLIGRPLAELRLTPCGSFDVCIERVPYFVLEVTATDWTSCQQDYSAETLLPGSEADDQSHRYVAYSPVYQPDPDGCQWQKLLPYQYIDSTWHYKYTIAAAFFPATMIALDMREFMGRSQPYFSHVDISQGDYPAHFRYPETKLGCDPSYACYRPDYIYIEEGYAEKMDLVIHEYSHRAHDALGSGWAVTDTTHFPEGVAELIRGVKETIGKNTCDGSAYRGGCYALPNVARGCATIDMEDLPRPPDYYTNTYRYSGWLYDLWDDNPDDMPEAGTTCPTICSPPPPPSDVLKIEFGELWDTFDQAHQVPEPFPTGVDPNNAPFPVPAQDWVQDWMAAHPPDDSDWARCEPEWRKLLTVSVHHDIYTNCSSFPAPPSAP